MKKALFLLGISWFCRPDGILLVTNNAPDNQVACVLSAEQSKKWIEKGGIGVKANTFTHQISTNPGYPACEDSFVSTQGGVSINNTIPMAIAFGTVWENSGKPNFLMPADCIFPSQDELNKLTGTSFFYGPPIAIPSPNTTTITCKDFYKKGTFATNLTGKPACKVGTNIQNQNTSRYNCGSEYHGGWDWDTSPVASTLDYYCDYIINGQGFAGPTPTDACSNCKQYNPDKCSSLPSSQNLCKYTISGITAEGGIKVSDCKDCPKPTVEYSEKTETCSYKIDEKTIEREGIVEEKSDCPTYLHESCVPVPRYQCVYNVEGITVQGGQAEDCKDCPPISSSSCHKIGEGNNYNY